MQTENSRIWKFLKYLSFTIIAIMAVVLLAQYINLAVLNGKNDSLQNSLQTDINTLEQKEKLLEDISTDQFIEDQAKENLGMKDDDEEVITLLFA